MGMIMIPSFPPRYLQGLVEERAVVLGREEFGFENELAGLQRVHRLATNGDVSQDSLHELEGSPNDSNEMDPRDQGVKK